MTTKPEPRTIQLVTMNPDGTIGEHVTNFCVNPSIPQAKIAARHEANASGKDVAILVCFPSEKPVVHEIVRR